MNDKQLKAIKDLLGPHWKYDYRNLIPGVVDQIDLISQSTGGNEVGLLDKAKEILAPSDDTTNKFNALCKHLGLKYKLIPEHYKFEEKEKANDQD